MKSNDSKLRYHIMLVFLVIVWGLEYAVSGDALEFVEKIVILNFKYFLGIIVIALVAIRTCKLRLPEPIDLPAIIGGALLGHIVFFYCEYSAMATIPVANITIIFGFLPIGSALIDKLIFHRRISTRLILFMAICIVGIGMTIGAHLSAMGGGDFTGYIFVIVALLAWLLYLFITENVTQKYGAIQVALYQTIIAFAVTLPLMAPHIPEIPKLPTRVILDLVYLGIVSEGLCFLIEITGLEKLGPTISAVYSNFLPVTTAFFGLILLHQELAPLQYLGGGIVILAGYLVIREKARLDSLD